MSSFTDQVSSFFTARGYDSTAIAGILGNSEQESTDNFGESGGGAWQELGSKWQGSSPLAQMQSILAGLSPFRSQLNAAGSPGAAADLVEADYEKAGIPALANRERYARQAYASLGRTRGGQGTAGAGGTALARMRAEANALIGYPYTWGGGHGSLGVPSGSPPGFDCSGYWSAILGAGGYLTSPQTTAGLHGGVLVPGKGVVTVYDRWNSDGEDHVIGNIAGVWYESGGTTTGGPHIMSAAAAAAQLAQGGFDAYHPAGMTRRTIGADNASSTYGGTRPGGATAPADDGQQVDALFTAYQDAGQEADSSGSSTVYASFWRNMIGGVVGGSLGGDIKHDTEPGLFKDTSNAIHGTTDFLKWVAWIFHPHNILRAVEFLAGFGIVAAGLSIIMKESTGQGPITAVANTAPGRIVKDVGEVAVVKRIANTATSQRVTTSRRSLRANAEASRTARRPSQPRAQPRSGSRSAAGPKDRAAYQQSSQKAATRKGAATRKRNADQKFGKDAPF
jgi:hypothetical protein